MRLPSIDSLITKATTTFKRFPLAIIAAITGSSFCILLSHLPYDLTDSHYYYRNIPMSCYLGMLLFIAISIFCECRDISSMVAALLRLAGITIQLPETLNPYFCKNLHIYAGTTRNS